MLPPPTPSASETRGNRAFNALMWALSRPGLPRELPTPGEETIIEALLDRECRVFCADPLLVTSVAETGADIAELEQADHAFLGNLTSARALTQLNIGSALYPDDGATAVIRVSFDTGPRVRLTGPGIDGAVEVTLGGLPDGFWKTRADCQQYPSGFDLFLIDGARLIGLPRSTKVEVL